MFVGTPSQDLMVAPYPTGELGEILDSLPTGRDEYTPVYPKSGSTRSSYLRSDFDGSGREWVFAFYSLAPVPNTHLHLFEKTESGWKSVFNYNETPGKLESIEFADLDGDDRKELITTWILYGSAERQLIVFVIKDNKLSTVFSETHTAYALADLNGDRLPELTVLVRDPTAFKARADVYKSSGGQMVALGSVALDGTVTDFAKITVAPRTGDGEAVFIDAYKSDGMITDVVMMRKGVAVSAFAVNTSETTHPTFRPMSIVCGDPDDDGLPEIPLLTVLAGYEEKNAEERAYLTEWRKFDGRNFKSVFFGVTALNDGYMLRFPEVWIGNVTFVRDSATRTRTFYLWNSKTKTMGAPILTIRVFSAESWNNAENDWIRLNGKFGFVYAARLYRTSKGYALTEEELKENFRLLND